MLTDSELNAIRGKALAGHATPPELMLAFGHFDLVLDRLRLLRDCMPDTIYIFGRNGEFQWSDEVPDQDIYDEYEELDLKALLGEY